MNYAVIDVGSNSVRLLLNGKKTLVNTQLAEKMTSGGLLLPQAMARTAEAIVNFCDEARKNGAVPKAFATEAVRSAANKEEFLSLLKKSDIELDVLSPAEEAEIGFFGAYCGDGTQGVLDVGGASSELAVGDGNAIIYSHSLPLGSVRLKDYSDDAEAMRAHARERVLEYGATPKFSKLISIGGTSSSLIAVRDGLSPYDPEKVHGQKLSLDEVEAVVERILSTPVEKRTEIKGMPPQKIRILPAGGILIAEIMRYLDVKCLTVSENDNLEGYLARLI